MKPHICIPISTEQFMALTDFLKSSDNDKDPVDVIAEAVSSWIDGAGSKQSPTALKTLKSSDRGYHWKDVFLPNGTSLRMKYKGDFYYAAVQGDNIIYESRGVSPSEFCNSVTNTSRNAWNDIWIKRPNDSEWVYANTLRKNTQN